MNDSTIVNALEFEMDFGVIVGSSVPLINARFPIQFQRKVVYQFCHLNLKIDSMGRLRPCIREGLGVFKCEKGGLEADECASILCRFDFEFP